MTEKIIYKWGPIHFGTTLYRGNIVHVGLQGGEVFIWAETDTDPSTCYLNRSVKLHPTGTPYTGEYLGTVVMPSGLVWHVIEVTHD